jgi:hypothetical protein
LLNLEYELLKTIRCLASRHRGENRVSGGHGELPEAQTAAMMQELSAFFQIDRGVPGGRPGCWMPTRQWSLPVRWLLGTSRISMCWTSI